MAKFKLLLLVGFLVLAPAWLGAAEESVVLADGTTIKVLFFQPQQTEKPPLAVLLAGGSNNQFMARAQFWLGKEMVERGWAVAVPISAEGRMYFIENPDLFLGIVEDLHNRHELQPGKALLAGISSGGSSALAIAAERPQRYLGVVATPGRLLDEQRFQTLEDLPIYLRIGEKDNFRWNNQLGTMVDFLHSAGANVDAAIVPGAKHIFPLDWENLQTWLEKVQQRPL